MHNDTMYFDYDLLEADIPVVVRAMDNIHNTALFPLPQQAEESRTKRRMGLGVTGVANTGEILGYEYGSDEFLDWLDDTLKFIRDNVYQASADLAIEKGAFPLFDAEKYCESGFIKTLPEKLVEQIRATGIRNSHLLSIAPTGTISLAADNISGGIEPVFSHEYTRTIQTFDGPIYEVVKDYAYNFYNVKGKKADDCTAEEHLNVLAVATKYVDSSVSKTINVSPNMPWEDFKNIYIEAWKLGCKGCTTFNVGGKRFGILNEVPVTKPAHNEEGAAACYIDPITGQKECS